MQQQATTGDFVKNYEQIGIDFIQVYYNLFDNFRGNDAMKQQLKDLYHPSALLTFEGTPVQGKDGIIAKLESLPFKKISRHLTKVDPQPMMDGKVFVTTFGLMKSDEDHPLSFSDTFVLSNFGDKYFIINQVFRVIVHDVAL